MSILICKELLMPKIFCLWGDLMIEIAWIGLILIIIAWVIQILSLSKGKKELLSSFVGLQALGILLIVLSELLTNSGLSILGMLNALSFLGAIVAMVLLMKKK